MLRVILFGTILFNAVAAAAVTVVLLIYHPVSRDEVTAPKFAQLQTALRSMPAAEGRDTALTLLAKLNDAMGKASIMVDRLFYVSAGLLVVNAGMMIICLAASRKPPQPPL